jgi:hypothetical protein
VKALFVVLLIALLSASAIFATVTFGEAQVVNSADIVLSPLSATIHVGEAVAFTVTVPKIIEATAYCQCFLDGVKVRNQNYPTWTFVSIPKSIINDISKLQVKLDDQQITYSSESQPDHCLITFNYHHSTHTVKIDLTSAASAPSISQIAIYAIVITAIAVAAFLFTRTKIKSRHSSKTWNHLC